MKFTLKSLLSFSLFSILAIGTFVYNSSTVLAVDNTKTCPANFTRDLRTGMTGEDVRELQKYLNTTGFIVSNEGPGSVGNETTMFGAFTRTALTNFQKANNIVAVYGVFDTQTRAYLGCTETDTTNSVTTTTEPSSFTFTRNLSLGMTGEDVRELQKFLNNNGFPVSDTGVGSKGNESTYFGSKTKEALIRFQENNVEAILKPFNLTRGTGFFYTSTRSFVNKTSSSITTTITPSTPPTSTTVVSTIPLHDNPFAPFFTLTYIPGFGGTVTGVSPQNVKPGGSGTPVTAKPYVNYSFVDWSDGVKTQTRTDANVTGYKTVTANFVGNQSSGGSSWGGGGGGGGGSVPTVTYTLTYTAGSNGTISGTASQTVSSGGSGSAVTAVADTGYHFTTWSDGVTTAARTDTGVAANLSVTASFAIDEQLTTPTFTPNSGAIALGVTTIQIDSDAGSTIYYTTDGTDPTTGSSHITSGETITLAGVANPIKAYAVKADYPDSAVGTSGAYTQDATTNLSALALSDVTLSPVFAAGTYTYTSMAVANAISTTRVTATGLGTLQMSVDYGASTTITTSVQSGALSLTAGATSTILVSALETGKTGKTYLVNVYRNYPAQATPTFSPAAGSLTFGDAVTITSAGADAIYYTTNGDDPTTASTLYTGPVTISSALTLKAIATKAGYDNSAIGSATYTQAQSANLSALALSDVTLSPVFAAGTYVYTSPAVANAISTTRVTATGAGVLQMSVNGGASTTITTGVQSGTLDLTAGATSTVLVSLTETGKATTTYAVGVYRNNTAQATPTFSPVAGAIAFGSTVTITSAGADAIYYTTNGDDPTTASTLYTGPVTISSALTLKALAVKAGYENSAIGSASYTQAQSANLSALALSDVTLSPVFAAGTYVYTSPAVAYAISTTRVTATGAGVLQMSVNGGASTTITTGVQSGTLDLTAGATSTVLVSLTETGKATTTYAVRVFRSEYVYALRTTGPGGGLIFYDKGSYSGSPSWRYLEAAPVSTEWTGTPWGYFGTNISGSDGVAVGTGYQNTNDFMTAGGEAGAASRLAYDLVSGGYSDWFLPSKDELNYMYLNLKLYSVGNYADDNYYCSSEVSDVAAWIQDFTSGNQYDSYFKNVGWRVRAVRAF